MRCLSSLDRVEFMISIAVFQKLEVSDKIKSNVVFLVSLLAGSIKPLNTKKNTYDKLVLAVRKLERIHLHIGLALVQVKEE